MRSRDSAILSRRSFLRVAATAVVGLPLLAACGPAQTPAATLAPTSAAAPKPTAAPAPPASAPAPTSAPAAPTVAPTVAATQATSGSAKAVLPVYVPATAVKADLPPSDAGLQSGFFTYPKTLVKTVTTPPGKGGDVTAFTQTAGTVPPPVDQNAAWQAVNKAVNANLKVQLVPAGDYQTKTATTMAGNEFPDYFQFQANLTINNIPQFLKANYADLTPYLSGDAIKDYPNLAAFPSSAWRKWCSTARFTASRFCGRA
jgi:putative aldouronate transport system substrate-binding protein